MHIHSEITYTVGCIDLKLKIIHAFVDIEWDPKINKYKNM
jgi:hypothetical protein